MNELERLHDAMLDGTLTESDRIALRRLLSDPGNRRDWWRLHTLVGRLHEELVTHVRQMPIKVSVSAPAPTSGTRSSTSMLPLSQRTNRPMNWPAMAALVAIAVGLAAWTIRAWHDHPDPIPLPAISIIGRITSGELHVNADQPSFRRLSAGDVLMAGDHLRSEGGGAFVLNDGSRCGWTNAVDLTASTSTTMTLHRGDMSIAAMPHPIEQPLIVCSTCAVATVLGTSFRLVADDQRTVLGVDHGIVRLATAQSTVQVGADTAAIASLAGGISALRPRAAPGSWRVDLTHIDGAAWHGAGGVGLPLPDGMTSEAVGLDRKPQAPDDPRRYLATPSRPLPGLVQLTRSSTIRLTLTAARPVSCEVFLVISDPLTGDHLGNAVGRISISGHGGEERFDLPLASFIGNAIVVRAVSASVSVMFLQWWGDDGGSVVKHLAIE